MTMQLKTVAVVGSMLVLMVSCGDGDDLPELPRGTIDAGHWDAGTLDARGPEADGGD